MFSVSVSFETSCSSRVDVLISYRSLSKFLQSRGLENYSWENVLSGVPPGEIPGYFPCSIERSNSLINSSYKSLGIREVMQYFRPYIIRPSSQMKMYVAKLILGGDAFIISSSSFTSSIRTESATETVPWSLGTEAV